MAPSAEASIATAAPSSSSNMNNTTPKRRRALSVSLSRKTIAFAVNYEPSVVDRYWTHPTPSSLVVKTPVPAPAVVATATPLVLESTPQRTTRRSRRRIAAPKEQEDQIESSSSTPITTTLTGATTTLPVVATPVLAPQTVPHDHHHLEDEDLEAAAATTPSSGITILTNDSSGSSTSSSSSSIHSRRSSREQKQRPVNLTRVRVRYDMEMVPAFDASSHSNIQDNHPHHQQGSVVWFPKTRKDWEESISELTAVCTSAVARKHSPGKPLVPPLSRDYIRDRIDIDDPLRGYQIRSAQGGWLQGFLLWTNFTTWTHFFTWDSMHEKSGLKKVASGNTISLTNSDGSNDPSSIREDTDGSLARELQALPRDGNPSDSGIVFPNVAEIALLGGLRCGGLLLRMALEDIRKNPQYKYVALQATDGSKKFYEHFGFKRVGAVCRYGSSVIGKGTQSHSLEIPTLDTPVSGYRHWTHANEAPESLNLHGGPSFMMCLKLDDSVPTTNLFDYVKSFTVDEKPLIRALGAASTPAPKAQPQPPRKSKGGKSVVLTGKRIYSDSSGLEPTNSTAKRRKMSVTDENIAPKGPAKVTPKTPKKVSSTNSKLSPPAAPSLLNPKPLQRPVEPSNKIQKVDKAVLCKQKVKSYPRDRAHFYNKVVQPSSGVANYYFVLHYSEPQQQLTLVPMKATGTLSGKRQGRPRFQCLVQETSANWLTAQPCGQYVPVPAFMVMKTPIVAQEAWDILGA
mmetsp:Transcript_40786/g.62732  ORF Transcript_40786/g.62732 Transcript_40786/m.62732 type:complete len:740 (-) Transcript_40786:220-2439(-)